MAAKKKHYAPEKHYAALAGILKDKASGKLPRGARFEIDTGADVVLIDGKGNVISDTFDSVAVADALLKRLGFKVENENVGA